MTAFERREAVPYEVGNLAAAKSGAWSPALISETIEELRPKLQSIVDAAPWIRPVDCDGLEDYLYDRARLKRLEVWLAEHGDRYPAGHKRAGELRDRDLQEVGALRRRCMAHRAALGLDPLSRSRLRLGQEALDLARLLSGEGDDDGQS